MVSNIILMDSPLEDISNYPSLLEFLAAPSKPKSDLYFVYIFLASVVFQILVLCLSHVLNVGLGNKHYLSLTPQH